MITTRTRGLARIGRGTGGFGGHVSSLIIKVWTSRHLWPSPLEYYYGPQYGFCFSFFFSLFVGSILNSCQSWFYFELERAKGVKGHNSTGILPFALSLSHLLSLCVCGHQSHHSSNFIDVNLRFTLYLHAC